jgi:hypothetical protein
MFFWERIEVLKEKKSFFFNVESDHRLQYIYIYIGHGKYGNFKTQKGHWFIEKKRKLILFLFILK